MVLELFMKKCVVGDSTEHQSSNRVSAHDEETLLGDDDEQKKFMLCQIKDRFRFSYNILAKFKVTELIVMSSFVFSGSQ
jgi:hypothetical protein